MINKIYQKLQNSPKEQENFLNVQHEIECTKMFQNFKITPTKNQDYLKVTK